MSSGQWHHLEHARPQALLVHKSHGQQKSVLTSSSICFLCSPAPSPSSSSNPLSLIDPCAGWPLGDSRGFIRLQQVVRRSYLSLPANLPTSVLILPPLNPTYFSSVLPPTVLRVSPTGIGWAGSSSQCISPHGCGRGAGKGARHDLACTFTRCVG